MKLKWFQYETSWFQSGTWLMILSFVDKWDNFVDNFWGVL